MTRPLQRSDQLWRCLLGAVLLAIGGRAAPAGDGDWRVEWSGFVAPEIRWFANAPADPGQRRHDLSVAAQPELYAESPDGRNSVLFVPFARLSSADPERSHFDVRELIWQTVGDTWELRAGLGKVFWGVTEALHLVDIINQTDLVENPDGEEKLGQPMVNLTFVEDWGSLDFFVLPGFRERTFAGREGRLRTQPRVDAGQARFDSGAGRGHIDIAVRYSHVFDDVDLGLYHFYGVSREPRFLPGLDGGGQPVLIPFYERIHQTGLDVQLTRDAWLWKLEAIRRSGQGATFYAATGGFEYTLFGVADTNADLGILAEYLYDERGEGVVPFQKDLLLGARLSLNDEQDTAILAGVLSDLDNGSRLFSLEASRRIGDAWKLSVEARTWSQIPRGEPLFSFRQDDFVQVELARYF